MKEFDSEFCNVKYLEADHAVLLTWKKFARGVAGKENHSKFYYL